MAETGTTACLQPLVVAVASGAAHHASRHSSLPTVPAVQVWRYHRAVVDPLERAIAHAQGV